MSTNYSTTNQSYKHLSETEWEKFEGYLSVGLKPAEIARRLGRNRPVDPKRGQIQKQEWHHGDPWPLHSDLYG